MLTGKSFTLEPRILGREVIFYAAALAELMWALADQELTWEECTVLICTYVVYILVCAFYVNIVNGLCPYPKEEEDVEDPEANLQVNPSANPTSRKSLLELKPDAELTTAPGGTRPKAATFDPSSTSAGESFEAPAPKVAMRSTRTGSVASVASRSAFNHTGPQDMFAARVVMMQAKRAARLSMFDQNDVDEFQDSVFTKNNIFDEDNSVEMAEARVRHLTGGARHLSEANAPGLARAQEDATTSKGTAEPRVSTHSNQSDGGEHEHVPRLSLPKTAKGKFMHIMTFPLILAFYVTIPYPRAKKWANWYGVSLLVSTVSGFLYNDLRFPCRIA